MTPVASRLVARWIAVAVAAALVLGAAPVPADSKSGTAKVDPALLAEAKAHPDRQFSIIVRGAALPSALKRPVAPVGQVGKGNGQDQNATAFIVDKAFMWTFKAEHKFTDKSSLSGLYIYNKTDEPGSTIMNPDRLFMADQDQWFGPLRRRPHDAPRLTVRNGTIMVSK